MWNAQVIKEHILCQLTSIMINPICVKDYMNALVTVTVLNHLRVSVTTNDIQRPRE